MKPIFYLLTTLGIFAAVPLAAQTNTDHAAHQPPKPGDAAPEK